jgi:hypothetical protein
MEGKILYITDRPAFATHLGAISAIQMYEPRHPRILNDFGGKEMIT